MTGYPLEKLSRDLDWPRLSVMVTHSLDFVGVIDDFEADIPYRFNYEIRPSPDAATIPFEDYL